MVSAAAHGNLDDLKRMLSPASTDNDNLDDDGNTLLSSSGSQSSLNASDSDLFSSSRPVSAMSNTSDLSETASGTSKNFRNPKKKTKKHRPTVSVDAFATVGPHAGCTALCAAAERGRLEVVEFLLDQRQADILLCSKDGYGPVYYACTRSNNVAVLEKLLLCRADPTCGIEFIVNLCARG